MAVRKRMDIYGAFTYNPPAMTYENVLAHIYALGRFGIKPGLERVKEILRALGDPQENVRTIHVAGTNGKGSTAAFISSILSEAGLKVGFYSSPHLIDFTERIRINDEQISRQDVVSLAERVLKVAPEGATFFEMVTAMGLLHFSDRQVDLAVLEAGMGGRSDATNAVSGILSVITPVDLDHREYLGDTVPVIALEKAGIIRSGRPLVLASQTEEAAAVIEAECLAKDVPLFSFGKEFTSSWAGERLRYEGLTISVDSLRPGIGGRYQSVNAACALAAAELLSSAGINIPPAAFRSGIERAKWPGRMEMMGESPRILLDGAHNPAAVAALVDSLAAVARQRLILVAGVMGDKDLAGVMGPLLPLADDVLAVSPSLPRAMPSAELAEWCRKAGFRCADAGSVASGISTAIEKGRPGDLVLVTGSLFTVGEARSFLLNRDFEPFRG